MWVYIKRHHVGILALLVALVGTTYVASRPQGKGVGTKQAESEKRTPVAPVPTSAVPLGDAVSQGGGSWRDRTLAAAIAVAGQRVVAQKVVRVAANAPWVEVGLSVVAGERLWSDTRGDGKWSGNPRYFPYSDANGLAVYPGSYRVDANAPVESLIGFVGGSPPNAREVSVAGTARPGGPGGIADPGFVEVGDTLKNFAPRTHGEIWLRNNDNTNYYSDVGRQVVKVILTRDARPQNARRWYRDLIR